MSVFCWLPWRDHYTKSWVPLSPCLVMKHSCKLQNTGSLDFLDHRQLSSVNAAPRNPPRGLPSFSPLPLQFSHIQFSDSSEPAMLLYTAVFHPWLQLRPFSSRYSQRHKSLCFRSFRNSPEWHYFVSFLLTSFISDLTFSEVPFLSFLMILSGKEVDVFSVCSLDPISALFSKEALMSN